MTYAEWFEAACKVDPEDTIHVSVETWRRCHYPPTSPEYIVTSFRIWSKKRQREFRGSSMEEALRFFIVSPPQAIQDIDIGEIPC